MQQQGLEGLWAAWPRPTADAWMHIAAFGALEAALQLLLPGKQHKGPITPKGNVPVYKVPYSPAERCYLAAKPTAVAVHILAPAWCLQHHSRRCHPIGEATELSLQANGVLAYFVTLGLLALGWRCVRRNLPPPLLPTAARVVGICGLTQPLTARAPCSRPRAVRDRRTGLFDPAHVYDILPEIISALNIFSLALCAFLYVKVCPVPSGAGGGRGGAMAPPPQHKYEQLAAQDCRQHGTVSIPAREW